MAENQIQKPAPQKSPIQTLADLIASRRDAFAAIAAKHFDPDRLVKLAQAALARTPKLAECTPSSLLVCLMRCAELGLEPDAALPAKRLYLVPRKNKKTGKMEATYVIDYRAKLQLARDTGLVKSILATEVRKNDRVHLEHSVDGESITKFKIEVDPFGERGPAIGYLAAARLESGEVQVAAMSVKEAEDFRDRFAPRWDGKLSDGPWKSDFAAMALKTVCNKLFNFLPAGESLAQQRVKRAIDEERELEEGGKALEDPEIDLGRLPPAPTRTEGVKEKLRARAGAPAASAPPPEPEEPDAPPGGDEWGLEGEADAAEEGERRAPSNDSPRNVRSTTR